MPALLDRFPAARHTWPALALAALSLAAALAVRAADDKAAPAAARPALTVSTVRPQPSTLPLGIGANGSIAAWQEAIIGTEANGLRLAEVRVNVGDPVKRGQVLATFKPDMVQADAAQIRATVAEAEAALAEASANAARARTLQDSGAISDLQINQYLTAERTAQARLDAHRAQARVQQLRVAQTQVLAPDDGVISARSATVGAVLPAGTELFRMIRQGRLEWRAEVAASDLKSIRPGMAVRVTPSGGSPVAGKVRMVAPTVDPQTRNGIVYVDLAPSAEARAGMFARGEFEIGTSRGLTLPQSAVLLRDGFSTVLQLGADDRVRSVKVTTGRRAGERIEITGGLPADARVVASGGGFLSDGDLVRVVDAAAGASAQARAAAPAASAVRR
ncbi:MAG: efflux RND transporter periplasmic adaptor subunit [Proteobacteria bacterium]|nr:efflux RND transporter periplasmic adaptor subunit [Pseudomonadota bacterium]